MIYLLSKMPGWASHRLPMLPYQHKFLAFKVFNFTQLLVVKLMYLLSMEMEKNQEICSGHGASIKLDNSVLER